MRNLLFHHEYSEGQYWYNEQACIDDLLEYLVEYLEREEIFDTMFRFHSLYEFIRRGLNGDTHWFEIVYEEAINHCISEYVYDGLYTDEEIKDFIIMDEKEG